MTKQRLAPHRLPDDLSPVAPDSASRENGLQAVGQAIAAHGDLAALFRDLTVALRPVVAFDYLHLGLYDPASRTTRLYLNEAADPQGNPVPAELPEQIPAD